MGGKQAIPKFNKKVIIVGGSFSGLTMAFGLMQSFDVLVIDKNDYFDYVCIAPRAIVQENFVEKCTLKYSEFFISKGGLVNFMHASLSQVNSDNSIEVQDGVSGERKTLPFDYLCICTGASYGEPIRSP